MDNELREEYFSRAYEHIKQIKDAVGSTAIMLGSSDNTGSMQTIYWKIFRIEKDIAVIKGLITIFLIIATISLIHFW